MALLNAVKGKCNSKKAMKNVIKYILDKDKTNVNLIDSINCTAEKTFQQFMITKQTHNKEDGRMYRHFVHSYNKHENITPELAHEISMKLLEHPKFKGFQIVAATHTDKDHIHTHFIINTVNFETGLKWNQSKKELEELKEYSNKLCKEYGLKYSFPKIKTDKKSKSISSGEYHSKKRGRSWKYEAFLAINDCRKTATSKEDFINKLEILGYKVRWEDNRKDITFTFLKDGKIRKINNDKFHPPDIFTKESLEKSFYLNSQYQNMRKEFDLKVKFEAKQELVLQTIKILEDNPDLGHKDYPRSYLENLESKQAIKEKMIEKAKGEGLDWSREY